MFDGKVNLGLATHPRKLVRGDLGVLSENGQLSATSASEGARMLIVAAKPLFEPIAKYGPCVMNTQDELRQAFSDYQRGAF